MKLVVPGSLSAWLGGRSQVLCQGATVGECIDDLERAFPGFKARIVDENGKIRRSVLFFLNGDSVRELGELDTPVKDGDEAGVIPLAAGG